MSDGINLLDPNKKQENALPEKRMRYMRFVAGALLFIVSASAFILFMLVSLSPLPALQRQEQSLRITLSNNSTDITKFALLHERATSISEFLKNRKSYDKILTLLQEKLPSNATISSIRVEQNTLVVTVKSTSLSALDGFMNSLIGYVQEKKGFKQATMTSLSTDDVTNDYALTVSLVML